LAVHGVAPLASNYALFLWLGAECSELVQRFREGFVNCRTENTSVRACLSARQHWNRRQPQDTLEAVLKCRSCRKGRYAPPVHMIKLTETREITPHKWVHPDEER
jgi:hypothetical protein